MDDPERMALLKHLLGLTEEISRGDYDRAHEIFALTSGRQGDSTVEELAEAFGMMLVQVEAREFHLEQIIDKLKETNKQLEEALRKVELLENIKIHLSKFVPHSVKSLIETNPAAPDLKKHDRKISVLFLDVAGYTRMSENVDPNEMNYLIERYFSAFLDDIHLNNGDINETAGDGLMIIFQQEKPVHHAVDAVTTALMIHDRVRSINKEESGRHEPITINIGINSGLCSVGSTCLEGITGTRWTYTASGPVTNIAARLGGLATNGQIYVGEETYRRVQGKFNLRSAGMHELKNVSRLVPVYEVIPWVKRLERIKVWFFSRLVDVKGLEDSRIQVLFSYPRTLDPLNPYHPT